MSGFNWNDHPIVQPGSAAPAPGKAFSWDDHPVVTPAPTPGIAQTALEGFGNGASLGYLPQLQAGAEMAGNAIGDVKDKALKVVGLDDLRSIDAQLRDKGFKLPEESYVAIRDANIKRQEEQAKANPVTAAASKIGGALATAVGTSTLAPAAAATRLARIRQAGQIGGVLAGVANPGDTKGELNLTGQIPERLDNAAKGTVLSSAIGALAEAPGAAKDAVNAGKNLLASKLGQDIRATPVGNKDAIEAAAKNLGIENVPKAVTTDNPTYQDLESGLSQSGSLPAKGIRDQYNTFFKALNKASEKISGLRGTDSEFASGSKIQADLGKQVSDARAPVSQMYEDLTPHLRKIEVNPDVTTKAFAALKRNELFKTADGKAMLADYQQSVGDVPDLASLKEFRSTLRNSLSKTASPLEEQRIGAIGDTITSIRDNSINALKDHMPKDLHPEVDKLIDDIALADSAHASNVKDINSVKTLVGNSDFKSPSTFAKKLGEMSEGDIARKAQNLDVGTMRNLRDKFPTVFEKAKAAKINDMIDSSTNAVSGFNDASFLKRYQGLDQEMKDLVFTPELQTHIESLQTVKQAIPDKLGPSGTHKSQMMMDMLNPKRNLLDYGIKKTLEGNTAAAAGEASVEPSRLATVLKLAVSQPAQRAGTPTAAVAKVADTPKKGPAKWANDGHDKLLEHADGDPSAKDLLEKSKSSMLEDPKTKNLLIQASDLKPGSKAMDKVMEKVKAKIASDE